MVIGVSAMAILNSIALLVLVIWTVLFLRPDVEIIYPQGEHVLLVQSWYGDSTTEPSLEMFDDWKNGRVHLVAGESDRRKFPFNSHANDELGIGWSLRAGPLALDEVIENGEPLRGGLNIKRSDVDFCRLKVYVDSKGKLIKQEKHNGICIK